MNPRHAALLAGAETRLAVYGTLAPGKKNHREVAHLRGEWSQGSVRGELIPAGWGMEHDAPALIWRPGDDPSAARVPIDLLESSDLPAAWPALDAFEGGEYLRILVTVAVEGAVVVAHLYALHPDVEVGLGGRADHHLEAEREDDG